MSSNLRSIRFDSTSQGIVALRDRTTQLEVERSLRKRGLRIRAARSGVDVLVELADVILDDAPEDARPRFLVLDDRLHGIMGSSIAGGIRALGWKTLVVLLSANDAHSCDTVVTLREDADREEICSAVLQGLGPRALSFHTTAFEAATSSASILGWSLDCQSDMVAVGLPTSHDEPLWEGPLTAWLAMVHPEDRSQLTRGIAAQVLGNLDALAMRIRWQRPQGEYRVLEFRCAPGTGNQLMGAMVDARSLENRSSHHLFEDRRTTPQPPSGHPRMMFDVVIRDIDGLVDELGFEFVDELTHRAAARARDFLRNEDRVQLCGVGMFGVQVEANAAGPDGETLKGRLYQALGAPMRVQNITIALDILIVPKDATWQLSNAAMSRGLRAT